MKKETIVYVDLGGSHTSVIAGKVLEDNSVHIIDQQSKPTNYVKSGIIQTENISTVAYDITTLQKYLNNKNQLTNIRSVTTNVNAKSTKTFEYEVTSTIGMKVTEDDLLKLEEKCEKEITEKNDKVHVFDCIPLEYAIDGNVIDNPVGKKASQLTILYNVVVGHNLIVTNITKCFERTGLAVDYIHTGIEAVSTAVLSEEQKEEGAILLMLGATTTTMGIYADGVLQDMLVVPFGGQNITDDIASVGISEEYAEKLKRLKGKAMTKLEQSPVIVQIPNVDENQEPIKFNTSFLAQIIEARLDETFDPIFNKINALDYLENAEIVLTGRASNLNGLLEYLEERTKRTIKFGDHSDWLSEDTDDIFYDTRYSEAVGSIILSNELYAQIEEEEPPIIENKIKGKSFFHKVGNKLINDTLPNLFDIDLTNE